MSGKNQVLFVSIPHSGIKIPSEAYWLKQLSHQTLMCDVDAFVDELYSPALKKYRISFIMFPWHRYSVDANRFAWDISSQTVERAEELLKTIYKNKSSQKSPSNVHWHKTTLGYILIKKPMTRKTHKILIKKYFQPYHNRLKESLNHIRQREGGKSYLLDLHSMPSKGSSFHKDIGQLRTDIVIGDNNGQSCSPAFRDLVLNAYQKAGFKTSLNYPYKGGSITQSYGQAQSGQEAVQIEMNRRLYMDEVKKEKNRDFKNIQIKLDLAVSYITKGMSCL